MRKKLWRYSVGAFLLAVVLLICTPLLVSGGVRLWIWWQARQQNLTCTVEKIEAPFLRPVELRGIHVLGKGSLRLDLTAASASISLNLKAILLRTRGRAVRTLLLQDVKGELHRNVTAPALPALSWSTLQKSLPENFKVDRLNLRLEDSVTVVVLRDIALSASEIETGIFSAGEVMISSPLFRQSFSGVRGATNWQDDRLTIAGLSLAHGLDVQSLTVDLSDLDDERLGLELEVDAFGGKIRANVSNEWRSQPSNWNVAGSATDVSLEQTSQSLGFTDHVDGMLHACKFTFRGDPHDPSHATASLWTELTQLSWRHRDADVIMLGAALYNRQIQLQQLYVKQGNNQLTLNGEAGFPASTFDWFNPDFRGTISASISNLGAFASLFGADAGDFAGEVAIEGTMNAGNRKIGGHLNAAGKSLSVLKMPVDTFATKLNVTSNTLEIEQLELRRRDDFLRGEGKMDLANAHAYSGKASVAAAKIGDYLPLLPSAWRHIITAGAVNGDWSGTGTTGAHSGSFHLLGKALRLSRPADLLPFNAEVQADYSPGSLFFRQAHLTNEHASLNGFLTVADKYIQLQAIAFDLNGKPDMRGNVFIPLSLTKMTGGARWTAALDPAQKLDVDLSVDPTDLGELSTALLGHACCTGNLATRISVFGGIDALQGWADVHTRDFAMAKDAARLSGDADVRFTSGTMVAKASAQLPGCDPVTLQATLPLRIPGPADATETESLAAEINFPAVFLNRLPRYLSRDAFRDGILSGKLTLANSWRHPSISGELQLTNGKLGATPLHLSDVSGRLVFHGQRASVDFLNLGNQEIDLSFRGDLMFADLHAIDLELTSGKAVVDLGHNHGGECINDIKITPLPANESIVASIDRLAFHGGLFGEPWTLALTDHRNEPNENGADAAAAGRSFPFCTEGKGVGSILILGCEPRPKPTPETARPRRKSKHR